ncbi:MAG: 6-phosphogluconolactonase [Pseudomonadota bacterium]
MDLKTYPDRDVMMLELANVLAGEIRTHLSQHPWTSFAVPGGTTPGPIFDAICGADLAWDRVHVMLTDERWVPETSDRSNTGLLRARLFQDKAKAAQFVPFFTGDDAPEPALPELDKTLADVTPLSILLLGMGADMHTASLFPGAEGLNEALAADAPNLLAVRGGNAPEPRVTLTAPVLMGALSTHVVITGSEKRAALEKAAGLGVQEAPINLVLPRATVHWAE